MDTLHDPSFLQLTLGDSADAVGGKVRVPGLNTSETTQVLITLLLPLGDQVTIRYLLLDAVFIKLP